MPKFISLKGLHNVFMSADGELILIDKTYEGSVIFCECYGDTLLGDEYVDGNTYIWGNGKLYPCSKKYKNLTEVVIDGSTKVLYNDDEIATISDVLEHASNTCKLIVDISTNADEYKPWIDGGYDEDHIQNGFVITPSADTSMGEWYKSDNKRVLLNIKPDAALRVFGTYLGGLENSSLIPCELIRVPDDNSGDTYLFSYNLRLDYVTIEGFLTIDEFDGSVVGTKGYSYSLNPVAIDPIRVDVVDNGDWSYSCTTNQSAEYVQSYLQSGKTLIEVAEHSGSITNYMVVNGVAGTANMTDADSPYEITGINAVIPQYKGDGKFTHKTLGVQIVSDGKGGKTVICFIIEQDVDTNDFIKTIDNRKADNNGNISIVDDSAISDDTTWSSTKINSDLNGVYKYVGSTYDYDTLPIGDGFTTHIVVPDIADDSALFVGMEPVWDNKANKTIGGIKLIFRNGNSQTKNVWFRNSENWTRENDTNISIDGSTLADIGYWTDVTEYGENVHEATISFTSSVKLSESSTVTMHAITWGAELLDGTKRDNEYIVNKDTVFNIISLSNGNVYNTIKTGMNYAWDGSVWDALGPTESGYTMLVGGAGEYKDNTIEEAINIIDEKTQDGNVILFSFDNIAEIMDSSTGIYGEYIMTGTTTSADMFYSFIGEETTSTITADEFFAKLVSSCVYLSTGLGEDTNLKMGINSMYIDGNTIYLALHAHYYDDSVYTFDATFNLNFGTKEATIKTVQWDGTEMDSAKPLMIEMEFSTSDETGDTINSYQLKRDGVAIKPKQIYELEKQGYRISYYSVQDDGTTKRLVMVNRAEGSNVENRLNLYYVETDSHSGDLSTPGITYFNFSADGKIIYNETTDKFTEGCVESIKLLRDIVNEDKYLGISATNRSIYTISANTIELDDVIEANTIPAYANIVTVVGTTETTYENAFCLGASTAFHGGVEYYYFATETSGSFIVKTEDIKDGKALKTNQEVQTYEWDSTTRVMNPIDGQMLYVSSFTYAPASVGLADALDVKKHLDAKQNKLTAGSGVVIDDNNKISISSEAQTVTLKLSVDLAENASLYKPYPYNMTDEEAIQNGFVVVPETMNLAEWYAADSKILLLDIKEAARSKVFGELLEDVDGVIACTSFRMSDDNLGPQYIFSYNLHAAFLNFSGWIATDQYETNEGSGVVTYSFSFNPFVSDPIEVIAIAQEDGSYECQVTTPARCEDYIQSGGRIVKFIKRPIRGNDSIPDYVFCDNAPTNGNDFSPYCLIGRVGTITDSFIEGTLVVTSMGTAAYIERECAMKSDIDGMVKSVNNVTPDSSGNVTIPSGGSTHILDAAFLFTVAVAMLPSQFDEHGTRSTTVDLNALGLSEDERLARLIEFINVGNIPTTTELLELLSNSILKLKLTDDSNSAYSDTVLELKESDYYTIISYIECEGGSNYKIKIDVNTNDYGNEGNVVLYLEHYELDNRESINNLIDNKADNTSSYIKCYATKAAYDADQTRVTPCVSYIEATNEVIYEDNTPTA